MVKMAQQQKQGPLILLIASRRTTHEVGLAVALDECRREGRARPSSRDQARREALREPEHLRPRSQRKTEILGSLASFETSLRLASPRSCCPSGRSHLDAPCRQSPPADREDGDRGFRGQPVGPKDRAGLRRSPEQARSRRRHRSPLVRYRKRRHVAQRRRPDELPIRQCTTVLWPSAKSMVTLLTVRT